MADDFKKLRIWQKSITLAEEIYSFTEMFPKEERFSLTSQIRRSANAIPANIAESSGRYFKKDKIRVLYIVRGEIEETRSHLILSKRLGYVTTEGYNDLEARYNDLKKQVNAFISHLQTY